MQKLTVKCVLAVLSPEDLDILTDTLWSRKVTTSWVGRFHDKLYLVDAKSRNDAWIKLVRKGVVSIYTLQSYECLPYHHSKWLRRQYDIALNDGTCDDVDETIDKIGQLLLDDLSDKEIIQACEKYIRYNSSMHLFPPNSVTCL